MNHLTKIGLLLAVLLSSNISPLVGQNPIKMKELKVKKVCVADVKASEVPALMDKENVAFHSIDVVNWNAFSYCPEVSFRIAYTDNAILLHYKVKEGSVRARYAEDNSPVYQDSCVEFFVSPVADGIYYNLECNCIGTILIGGGAPGNRVRATLDTMALVDRWASLGSDPFEERMGDTEWEVALIMPYVTFFKHQITSLDGQTIRANFYKCGDELNKPHYISWNPIEVEKPSFHQPGYFGILNFVETQINAD